MIACRILFNKHTPINGIFIHPQPMFIVHTIDITNGGLDHHSNVLLQINPVIITIVLFIHLCRL